MTDKIYFGTYTKRQSKGIYQAEFDEETGSLSQLSLLAEEANPTYLTFDTPNFFYSVGAENSLGGIAAFSYDGNLINHVVDEGAPLCYVSYDKDRKLVYGANYHKGQVLSYQQKEDGSLELADTVTHQGHGPHENQASPHVHFADLTPDNYLVTCDLGTDQVITYDVSDQGKLKEIARYQSVAGAGSRHLVFHPYNKIAYLICELNSTIEVLIYDGCGEFERMQVISTLPEDHTGFNGTAAIRLSKDGRFLYASNRGHDSIAVYEVLADSSLTLVEIVKTNGQTPRDFSFSPSQHHLIVVHQDSDNATVFTRNQKNGKLKEISHNFFVPEAVCVTFDTK